MKKEGTNKKYIDCIYYVKYLLTRAGEINFGFWTKRNSVSGVRNEMEMAPFLFSWHSKPKYFNSSLNVKWCIKYGYFDIQSHGCRKPGLGLLFKLLRAPVILKHFVLQSFHAYFHVSDTFISVNSPILQVARESWF